MDSDHESVSIWEDEYEFGGGNGNGNDHPHSNISRLSMCSTSTSTTVYGHDDEDEDSMTRMFMSRLSMEDDQGYGDHGDADADVDEEFKDEGKLEISGVLFSKYDYDKEPLGLGLQATPPRRRNHRSQQKQIEGGLQGVVKEYYASENEAHDHLRRRRRRRRRRSRGVMIRDEISSNSSEGGRRLRCLCMGLEEVKACSCRDLIGFHLDLEHHHRRTPTPLHSSTITPTNTNTNTSSSRLFVSGYSTLDTASGPNSPISNWRICSPGDDPRDVKARLRVWAQAVALASSSMSGHACN